MNAALLCPGPSLTQTWPRRFERYARVFGVNSVAWIYEVDWLFYGDEHIVDPDKHPERAPAGTRFHKPRHGSLNIIKHSRAIKGCDFTFPNAVAECLDWLEGSQRLHIFGFDCSATGDAGGAKLGDHSVRRWEQELSFLRSICDERITLIGPIARRKPIVEFLSGHANAADLYVELTRCA